MYGYGCGYPNYGGGCGGGLGILWIVIIIFIIFFLFCGNGFNNSCPNRKGC